MTPTDKIEGMLREAMLKDAASFDPIEKLVVRHCAEAIAPLGAELVEAAHELDDALEDGLCNSGIPGFDKDRLERAQIQLRAVLAKWEMK